MTETARHETGEHVDLLTVMGDIEAAAIAKDDAADYYFGACSTGGGGALAMTIAISGISQCITVGMSGRIFSNKEIITEIKARKKVFGLVRRDTDVIVSIVLRTILGL